MFEKASRMKLRIGTERGSISTEDLWDLPLLSNDGFCLDDIAKGLNRALKESEEESFVVKKNTGDETIDLTFSIVKHIIDTKLAEAEEKKNQAAIKAKKQLIAEILEDKEIDTLKGKSKAALKKIYDEL
jgi:tRNA A37 threonylcarbamoyltransferase TsaD